MTEQPQAEEVQPTGSVRFDLRSRESGSGPAVVLVHGFPMDSQIFDAQLEAAERGELAARIICVDLPGFGQTQFDDDGVASPSLLEVGVLAESLANAIVRTCSGPVVAGGVAIGAYVCVELARSHPELVRALVLSGAKAAPDSPRMLPQREAVARMALEQGSVAVADELAQHPLGPDATDEQRERIHDLIAAADPRAIAALVLGLARRPDPTPVLAALTVPVLVIAGSADPFVPLAESQRLAEVIPDGRLVTLDGVGHIAPLEAPDEYTAALGEFLTTLP